MEEFIKGKSNYTLKKYLLSSFQEYSKAINQLFLLEPTYIEGYTPVQRVAYIMHVHNSRSISLLRAMLKNVTGGIVSLRSRQFKNFLLQHSKSTTKKPVKKIVDDISASDSDEVETLYI